MHGSWDYHNELLRVWGIALVDSSAQPKIPAIVVAKRRSAFLLADLSAVYPPFVWPGAGLPGPSDALVRRLFGGQADMAAHHRLIPRPSRLASYPSTPNPIPKNHKLLEESISIYAYTYILRTSPLPR